MFHATLGPEIFASIYLPQLSLLKWGVVKYSGVSLPAAGGYSSLTDIVFKHTYLLFINLKLYSPLVRIKSTQNRYQILRTYPSIEKRHQLLQPTHPPIPLFNHPLTYQCCPGDIC
jgi:hypothetical protein